MERIRRLIGFQESETGGGRWLAGMLTVALLVAVGCATVIGQPENRASARMEAGISADVRAHPGYMDFQAMGVPSDREPSAEIMLNQMLLNIATTALRESHEEMRALMEGLNLSLFHLAVYEDLDKASVKGNILRFVANESNRPDFKYFPSEYWAAANKEKREWLTPTSPTMSKNESGCSR